MPVWYALRVKIFRGRLDDDLDRALEYLDSEYSVNGSDWSARHSAPGKLPADLEGATIKIKTRAGGDALIRTVVEVLHRDADYVLVRDSDKG